MTQRSETKISKTCEVFPVGIDERACGKPTAYAYPASGGGFMALCTEHAKPHMGAGGVKPVAEWNAEANRV